MTMCQVSEKEQNDVTDHIALVKNYGIQLEKIKLEIDGEEFYISG